jgi:hypothetical protein
MSLSRPSAPARRRALGPALLTAGLALLLPAAGLAQMEYEVKGAFLFKFLSYIEWPPESLDGDHGPLVIGVLGDDGVRASLQDIVQGRQAQGRPVEVRRLKSGDSADGMHVVFVGRSEAGALPALTGKQGLLVVSDSADALTRGAMIHLLLVENRIRFEVDPQAAEHSGLHISSRLLSLAQSVKPGSAS